MSQYGLRAEAGRNIVITMAVLGIVSIMSVVMRFLSRRVQKVAPAWDDYLMLLALCYVIVSTVLVITTVTMGGVGLHMTEVKFADVEYTLKCIIVLQSLYGAGLATVKTSMMVFYYRLFGTNHTIRIAIWITGAIVWAWGMSIVLESFLLCSPVEYNWNPELPGGKCGNRNAAFVAAGILNMITDLLVMALPIPYIWKLQMPLSRRIALSLIFCLGLFVSAVSIVRVKSLLSLNFEDVTYTLPLPLMWSIVEEQLAVVAANLALLRPILAIILPQGWLGSSRHKTNSASAGVQLDSQRSYNMINIDNNKSEISARTKKQSSRRWSEDEESRNSDTDLARFGVPPAGIRIQRDFQVGVE